MSTCKRLIAVGGMALGLLATSVFVATDALAQAQAVDSAAVQKFKRMTEFLDGLQQFSVNTQSIIEESRFGGHRVDFDLAAKVTVKRPNKLSAARSGQLLNEQLFYDGTPRVPARPDLRRLGRHVDRRTRRSSPRIQIQRSAARHAARIHLPGAGGAFGRRQRLRMDPPLVHGQGGRAEAAVSAPGRELDGEHEPGHLGGQQTRPGTDGPGLSASGNRQHLGQSACQLQPLWPLLCRGLRHDRAGHAADGGGPRGALRGGGRFGRALAGGAVLDHADQCHGTVCVSILATHDIDDFRMRFRIEATLYVEPISEAVFFDSSVEIDTGAIRVESGL